MTDKTSFLQSLMHIIKGNMGTGMLAMPNSFAHAGLIGAVIGLPLLCLIATYCVHLLVRSSQHMESKMKWINLDYAELAKGAFKSGPSWLKPWSGVMCRLVDAVLIISQMGICCVYIVFIVDNLKIVLCSYDVEVAPHYLYFVTLPVILLLSYIRTLKRLAIASACANVLQVLGIAIIIEYLIREMPEKPELDYIRPIPDMALAFGSAMFAFEGISVVLPVYSRMKRPELMGGCAGLINLSYVILLVLYFTIGFFGYLKFGSKTMGSITLNLPENYDIVRAIFSVSLFLTYPLQFYVPNEIVWNWARSKLFDVPDKATPKEHLKYEYLCRTMMVLITFILAITVPKLDLMMDLVGSISGTALSIVLPPLVHLAAFWDDTSGISKAFMVVVDLSLAAFGLTASASGSYFSFLAIAKSLSDNTLTNDLNTTNPPVHQH